MKLKIFLAQSYLGVMSFMGLLYMRDSFLESRVPGAFVVAIWFILTFFSLVYLLDPEPEKERRRDS